MGARLFYRKGDIFGTSQAVLAHGVNCRGVFGAGMAKAVGDRWPEARAAYLQKYRTEGWRLGEAQFVDAQDIWIANMATQDTYGRTGRHVDYGAVGSCFDVVAEFAKELGSGIATVRIGCGLGGGRWSEVEPILIEAVKKHQVSIEVWTPVKT